MEGVIVILALLFGGIALWGAMGMLQAYRSRNELDGESAVKAGEERAV